MKLIFENKLKTCLLHLIVHQITCKRHRILPFFKLLDEHIATCHIYVYDEGTRTEQLLNYDPFQITVHACSAFFIFLPARYNRRCFKVPSCAHARPVENRNV